MNTIFVWPPAPKAGKPKPGTSGGGVSIWPEGLGQSGHGTAPAGQGERASQQHPTSCCPWEPPGLCCPDPPLGLSDPASSTCQVPFIKDKSKCSLQAADAVCGALVAPCVHTEFALWPAALGAVAAWRQASCSGSGQVLRPLAGSTALAPPQEGHGRLAMYERGGLLSLTSATFFRVVVLVLELLLPPDWSRGHILPPWLSPGTQRVTV